MIEYMCVSKNMCKYEHTRIPGRESLAPLTPQGKNKLTSYTLTSREIHQPGRPSNLLTTTNEEERGSGRNVNMIVSPPHKTEEEEVEV